MRTKIQVTRPSPVRSPRNIRRTSGISLPKPSHNAQHRRRKNNIRHNSHADRETLQPQVPMQTGPDTAGSSGSIRDDQSLRVNEEETADQEMFENDSEYDGGYDTDDRFSPLPDSDNGEGDSDYIFESDSEESKKPLKTSTHSYSLRGTTRRGTGTNPQTSATCTTTEKVYNTRARARQGGPLS